MDTIKNEYLGPVTCSTLVGIRDYTFELSFAAFHDALAGCQIRGGGTWIRIGTLVWDAAIVSVASTWYALLMMRDLECC